MAAIAAIRCSASWRRLDKEGSGLERFRSGAAEQLELDRSFRFSVGGGAAAGFRTCGAQPPWPSAVGSASVRTGECVPTIGACTFTLAAAGGRTISPQSARPRLRTLRARLTERGRASPCQATRFTSAGHLPSHSRPAHAQSIFGARGRAARAASPRGATRAARARDPRPRVHHRTHHSLSTPHVIPHG
jgi:hypothetical protein